MTLDLLHWVLIGVAAVTTLSRFMPLVAPARPGPPALVPVVSDGIAVVRYGVSILERWLLGISPPASSPAAAAPPSPDSSGPTVTVRLVVQPTATVATTQ